MNEHLEPLPDRHDELLDDDYLWDGEGTPVEDVTYLEEQLRPLRAHARPKLAMLDRFDAPLRPLMMRAAFIAAGLLLAFAVGWQLLRPTSADDVITPWRVVALTGSATIDDAPIKDESRLRVGSTLVTDALGKAKITVADGLGDITVDPNSRISLVRTRADQEHRLALASGAIEALVVSPPRVFFIDTAAGTAVDMGCRYRLEIDEDGNGFIHVMSGAVAMEQDEWTSLVPNGARCVLRADMRPGTPYYTDASERFTGLLNKYDLYGPDEGIIDALLVTDRVRDTLSLLHMLRTTDVVYRQRIAERIAELGGLPREYTLKEMIALNDRALAAWRRHLQPQWRRAKP